MQVKYQDYLPHLAGYQLSHTQKMEALEALWHFCEGLMDAYLREDGTSRALAEQAKLTRQSKTSNVEKLTSLTGKKAPDSA